MTLSKPGGDGAGAALSVSAINVVPQMGKEARQQGAPVAAPASASMVSRAEPVSASGVPAAKPAAGAEAPKAQGIVSLGSASAAGAAGADASKSGLKALGSPVRLAALRPVGGVAAVPASVGGGGAQGGNGASPFGLRPKGGDTGLITMSAVAEPAVAAAPAPAAEERRAAVPSADDEVVRPKLDQRALYYQLMNGLYDAVLILDDQGHVVDCNKRVGALLGYTREEAWDLPVEKIITGMSSQMFDHLRRNLAENHHILIDARCFRKDGSSFAGEVGVSTLSLTRGVNIVFMVRNVERRKSAMDELRRSHAAFETSLAPTFVCDPEGVFLAVNRAFLDAFGIPDEAQAKRVRLVDLLPDAARLFLRATCGEKLREKLQVATPNGLPLKLELVFSPVQSGQNVTAVVGSILQL